MTQLMLLAAFYGIAAGILIPRVAYRLAVEPETPWRAICPQGHPIRTWAGPARCATCTTPYGPSVFPITLTTALGCALLAHVTGPRPELMVWLLAAPVLVLLGVIDLTAHRLPDVLTLPLAVSALAGLGVAALLPGAGGSFTGALGGMLALAGGYFVLFLFSPRSLGFGDVKLALALGAVLGWYGWTSLVAGAMAAQVLAGVYALALLMFRKASRTSSIPFGPFLAGGTLLGVLLGAAGA
ncbi:prepilin peptidase [Streptomyces sp. NPDC056269]|uniref:prepilin peptidase n=1 Tax=Streptomyces sp. NPDC056269 TaxID=3345768 RepID=UPI0035D927C1